ncbi:transposase [Bifidobacterium longum subsp. longum]|uniref:IS66 family transposase n=1 Tax=Bifidobacterium longum TaxID=216816 RepID=UPI003B991A3C
MRAPQPEPPIPGSFATPSLLAWIVNGKYVMSLPLYRIEADLKACVYFVKSVFRV